MSVTDSITSWMINGCDSRGGKLKFTGLCCVLACSPQANRYSETVFNKELNPIASVRQRESLGCDGFNDDMTTTGTVGSSVGLFHDKLCVSMFKSCEMLRDRTEVFVHE